MPFDPDDYSPYPSLNGKWVGPVCTIIGLVFIGTQVVAWMTVGVFSGKLSGVGIGMLMVGLMGIFYHFDDKRSKTQPKAADDHEPEWLDDDDAFDNDPNGTK